MNGSSRGKRDQTPCPAGEPGAEPDAGGLEAASKFHPLT